MSIVKSTKEIQPDEAQSTLVERSSVKFLVSIEDKPYFHWQLPILAESLCYKIPQSWELLVVVLNNHGPLSEAMTQVLTAYELTYFTAMNPGANQEIDFSCDTKGYLGWNKIQALSAVSDYVKNDDLVYLMDSDIFVFQDLNFQIFPSGNALCEHWLIKNEPFLSSDGDQTGINLQTLLDAMGCPQAFKPGGVFICLTGETVKNAKFIQDCFRFTQILFLAGRIMDFKDKVWMAEMPCFALALAANDILYDLINPPELGVHFHNHEIISSGSFYHYYRKRTEKHAGAFFESPWSKQDFFTRNFLEADLDSFYTDACTEQERYFFELARTAKQKLGLDTVYAYEPVPFTGKAQNGLFPDDSLEEHEFENVISSPHFQIDEFLSISEFQELQNAALQYGETLNTGASWHKDSVSCLEGGFLAFRDTDSAGIIVNGVRQAFSEILAKLDIGMFPIKMVEVELRRNHEEGFGVLQNDRGTQQTESRELTFLFSFHPDSHLSSGNELLLYDLKDDNGLRVKADSCTTLALKPNSLVVFPSYCLYEVRAIQSGSKYLVENDFLVKGWVRRQRKRLPPTQMPDSILEWAKKFQGQVTQKNGAVAV